MPGFTPEHPDYNTPVVTSDFWECPSCKIRFTAHGKSTDDVVREQQEHFMYSHSPLELVKLVVPQVKRYKLS
jgi:hypothetical protein